VPVHRCHLDARIPDDGASLRAFKSFRDDGSVNSMRVTVEDNGASAVRRGSAGDQGFVALRWPGEHRAEPKDASFDWDEGSIQITYLSANSGERHRILRGEEWRQVIVDRNNAALTYASEGRRELFLPGTTLHLVSDLEPLSSPGSLNMSLDSLVAWGMGAERITVYEVMVTRRPRRSNSYPTSPAGRRRVVAAYDVDVAALARTAGLVRETVGRWEANIAETWRTCERTTEGGEVIIRRRTPAARREQPVVKRGLAPSSLTAVPPMTRIRVSQFDLPERGSN
jgi:hypothetical protein